MLSLQCSLWGFVTGTNETRKCLLLKYVLKCFISQNKNLTKQNKNLLLAFLLTLSYWYDKAMPPTYYVSCHCIDLLQNITNGEGLKDNKATFLLSVFSALLLFRIQLHVSSRTVYPQTLTSDMNPHPLVRSQRCWLFMNELWPSGV